MEGPRTQRHHPARFDDLPDGAYVLHEGEPWLLLAGELHRWSPGGYTARTGRPSGAATLITPPSLVHVLRTGWEGVVVPLFHPSVS